ncbi:unnamed protein product [Eruca vesicaria subsp. sativa]|uniref:DUF674 family protein n=1 Tax=Eruca vesicaria subsp. sativa TaxID=29727 RepID=A0ABC8JQU7_ERUVS|nr:unnamed protein product [Eruca vesicaria subsp. sativa]
MANSAAKPKFSLRLLIDEEKNRVVLAEAGKDFVDVLCSLLTLPMGTIVRLLEKHQTPQSPVVGCFHKLYKSVSDMSDDNFEAQACKNLLLYPRSVKESLSRKLKLNIDDTVATGFFICPYFMSNESCCKVYSNTSASRCCYCGRAMSCEIQVQGELADGVLPSCRTSFIITDDLKVSLNSMGLVLNVLNDLGYAGFDKLQEMLIDVGSEEVLTLLGCLFTSQVPLTDTFLKKHCMARKRKVLTPLVQEIVVSGDPDKCVTIKVYIRKTDMTILFAECREDFIDLLFTFLAIPLEFACELSVDNVNMGCVGNICRSLKDLSYEKPKEVTDSKCMLPYHYNFRAQLLDIAIQEGDSGLECLIPTSGASSDCMFSRKIKKDVLSKGERIVKFAPMHSNPPSYVGVGFVKGETSFIVSDDLFITPMSTSSTISLLSKLQLNISDIDEQVINITKAEAVNLLRASLITNSALTNGLSNFLSKMEPQEATPSSSKNPKTQMPL